MAVRCDAAERHCPVAALHSTLIDIFRTAIVARLRRWTRRGVLWTRMRGREGDGTKTEGPLSSKSRKSKFSQPAVNGLFPETIVRDYGMRVGVDQELRKIRPHIVLQYVAVSQFGRRREIRLLAARDLSPGLLHSRTEVE